MVQNRADLIGGIMQAVRAGDIPRAAPVISTFIMTLPFESGCGLFDVMPTFGSEDVQDILNATRKETCGRIQRFIEETSDKGERFVGDEFKSGEGLLRKWIKDPLNPANIGGAGFDFLGDTFRNFSRAIRKDSNCGSSGGFRPEPDSGFVTISGATGLLRLKDQRRPSL
jgi:hypothetical protein